MTNDILISDFTDIRFQAAFQQYFSELGYKLDNWEPLFHEMNHDGRGNMAYVRLTDGGDVVGFIQFCIMPFDSWFFESKLGFIREFWIAPNYRKQGQGKELLKLAEDWFCSQNVFQTILTSRTAETFYLRCGYQKNDNFLAKNKHPSYTKILR